MKNLYPKWKCLTKENPEKSQSMSVYTFLTVDMNIHAIDNKCRYDMFVRSYVVYLYIFDDMK